MMKLMAENPEVTLLTMDFDESMSICKALDVQVRGALFSFLRGWGLGSLLTRAASSEGRGSGAGSDLRACCAAP